MLSFLFFSPLWCLTQAAVYLQLLKLLRSSAPDRESWWPGGPRRAQSVARWAWILSLWSQLIWGWLMSLMKYDYIQDL